MLLLLPFVLLINGLKLKFFPSKNPKTFVTPFGFAAYSQQDSSLLNYPWHDIEKIEMWSEEGQEVPVVSMKSGESVKLKGVPKTQIKTLCQQHQIPFYEDIILAQDD